MRQEEIRQTTKTMSQVKVFFFFFSIRTSWCEISNCTTLRENMMYRYKIKFNLIIANVLRQKVDYIFFVD